jgi:arylsulfatase A-like enzyme/Flp pilus assembly protein TadD
VNQSKGTPAGLRKLEGIFVALLLGAVWCGLPSVLAAQSAARANVLLITVDTLRADHLGCYGYRRIKTPNIDQLAREGIQFDRAFAQVPLTLPSHAVILTGTYPMYNTVRDFTGVGLPGSIGILSEAFERRGYSTAAFVSAFVLDGSWGLRRGFQTYDDVFDAKQFETQTPGNIQRRAKETVDRFLGWFPARRSGPFFVWLHLYDPHSPYDPPEPFHSQYAGHLYDGEIAYCDEQLGRVFMALKQAGVYDQTLIVFLSDHGESLGEHGEDEHGFFLYSATLHVPLIVKTTGDTRLAERRVDAVVGTVDVAPTILQLVALHDHLTEQFQGSSLASLLLGKAPAEERTAYAETYYPRNSFGWSPLRALIGPRYVFIDAPDPELYDPAKDPGEKVNLYIGRRAEANALKARLDALTERYISKTAPGGGPPLSAETLEKLKSLGYLAYSAPAAQPDARGNLPDPKAKVRTYRAILRATDLAQAGRPTESDRVLHDLARTETQIYLIPFMRAENAFREGRLKEAEREFLACLKLNPKFSQAIMGAARAYHADHQDDKAKPLLEVALHQNPQNFLASYALGVIAADEKKSDEAVRYFQAAIRDKPNYGPAYRSVGIAQVERQEYREALPNLQRARDLTPADAVLLNYLAIAVSHAEDPRQAIGLYLQALELKPDYAGARLNLAMAYQKLGERENARRQFKILCDSGSSLCQQFRQAFE